MWDSNRLGDRGRGEHEGLGLPLSKFVGKMQVCEGICKSDPINSGMLQLYAKAQPLTLLTAMIPGIPQKQSTFMSTSSSRMPNTIVSVLDRGTGRRVLKCNKRRIESKLNLEVASLANLES
jgi:hypothetical protein